jgi:hypothetical protein
MSKFKCFIVFEDENKKQIGQGNAMGHGCTESEAKHTALKNWKKLNKKHLPHNAVLEVYKVS